MLLNKLGLCVKELGEYPDLCQLPNYREYDTMLKNKKKVTLLQKQKENTAILGLWYKCATILRYNNCQYNFLKTWYNKYFPWVDKKNIQIPFLTS